MESERAVDGRGIAGLFGSMVGKLSSLERIDQEGKKDLIIENIRLRHHAPISFLLGRF